MQATLTRPNQIIKQALSPASKNLAPKRPIKFSDIKLQKPKAPVNQKPISSVSKFLGKLRKSTIFEYYPVLSVFFGLMVGLETLTNKAKASVGNLFLSGLLVSSSFLLEKLVFPFLDKHTTPDNKVAIDLDNDIAWDKNDKPVVHRSMWRLAGNTSSLQKEGDFRNVGVQKGGMLILSGPPGTGKTAIAKGIANQFDMGLIKVDVANAQNKFVGDSEKIITKYIERAKRENSILLFDDAEVLFQKRGRGGPNSSHDDKMTASFMNAFDEAQNSPEANRLIVIFTTNTPDLLDDAIVDRALKARIGEPNLELRFEIFKKKLDAHNVKEEAYSKLINEEKVQLMKLLDRFKFTGRGVEDGLLEGLALADERIADLKFEKNLKTEDQRLKVEDLRLAFENIEKNDKAASVSSLKPPSKLDILKGFFDSEPEKALETHKPEAKPAASGFLDSLLNIFSPKS